MAKIKESRKKRTARNMPQVYILMRLYCADINSYEVFLKSLDGALNSVKENKEHYERITLLINDDTRSDIKQEYYRDYIAKRNQKLDSLFTPEGWKDTHSPGGERSAYATFRLRDFFVTMGGSPNDIAITLDQDDLLKPWAVKSIVSSMKPNGIVVSPFEMRDEQNLDITDDGGRKHNHLARKLKRKKYARRFIIGQQIPPKEKPGKFFIPHGWHELKDLLSLFCSNIGLRFNQFLTWFKNMLTGKNNVADLSSIGWTKSYSRSVLAKFHSDLKAFLCSRGGAKDFFKHHRAYEDFIDFYVLLFKGLEIRGVRERTHVYNKHPESITSSPKIEDFRDVRTAMLIALIDLCYAHEESGYYVKNGKDDAGLEVYLKHPYTPLCADYKSKLIRFVSSKVYQIETIIGKYIKEYQEGKTQFAEFAEKTHSGYFTSKLCRLGLRENRGIEQDEELFEHADYLTAEDTRRHFSDLFSVHVFNDVPQYHEELKAASSRHVLRKAISFEKPRKKGPQIDETDQKVAAIMAGSKTPHQKQIIRLKWIRRILGGAVVTLIVLGLIHSFSPCHPFGDSFCLSSFFSTYDTIAAAVIAFIGVLLTLLSNEISKVRIIAEDEESTTKLYYSEFQDFIRHLEANLKVMLQVRKEMQEGKHHPEDIHFDNLKWPETSSLFSDEMAKLIARDRVDDFARLKVNLRNINNSAEWLKQRAHSGERMEEELEWEITRYIGYLVNMYYLDENSFRFPSQDSLDRFIHDNAIKHKLTALFMDYDYTLRDKQVNYFIDRYYDDRRMKRAVLF